MPPLERDRRWYGWPIGSRTWISTGKGLDDPQGIFPELTPRECEVLVLIAKRLKNDEIADRLYISPKTVRNHNTRIFSKLQVNSRAKAIVLAREVGLGKE